MLLASARTASRALAINSKTFVSLKSPVTRKFLDKLQAPTELSAACRFKSGGPGGAVVGIDLGTTNSCVAVMEGKVIEIFNS
jgi:hypothetical protein